MGKLEPFHTFAGRVNRSIAGDRDAARRYRELGDEARAFESEASAARWNEEISRRLRGGRVQAVK